MLKIILSIFGLLILALGALFLMREQIAELVAKRYFNTYGLSNASLEVHSIGAQSSLVSFAALVDTPTFQIDAKLPQVVIEYQVSDLMSKKLNAITVDGGEACLNVKANKSSTTTNSNFSFDFSSQLRELPVSKMKVDGVVNCLFGNSRIPVHFNMEKTAMSPEAVYDLEIDIEKQKVEVLSRAFIVPEELKLDSGTFEASIRASNREGALAIRANIIANELSGAITGVAFQGFNGKAVINDFSPVSMAEFSNFSIERVLYGLEIKNISGQYRTVNSDLALRNLKGEILGGEILLEEGRLPLKGSNWQMEFKLKNIDLNKVLELYPQEQITASGKVDVTLPITHDARGFRVERGRLVAKEIGIIKVKRFDVGKQFAETINMLSDFQYDSLSAEIDYEPQGDLELKLHLSGKNKNWQAGRPVNLNVNLSENVPALIRSIRLASGQSQELDNIVRQSNER